MEELELGPAVQIPSEVLHPLFSTKSLISTKLWLQIFSFSDPKYVLQDLALVCQHFHSLSKDEMLWKVICTRIGASNQNESGSWLQTFMAKSGKHHHPPHVVWAVLGHVDCGKSTLCGRMKLATAQDKRKEEDIYNPTVTSSSRSSKGLEFLVDHSEEERERGQTLREHIIFCNTPDHSVALIDTPGYRCLIKHTYSASTMADLALLVVSARNGEFEAGFDLNAQTKEHMLFAYTMGLSKIVIAINKLDTFSGTDAKDRFEFIMSEVLKYTRRVGYKPEHTVFVPISALHGDNLFPRSPSPITGEAPFPISLWHNGPTLWEVLTSHLEPERKSTEPLRMTILRHFKRTDNEVILGGRILTGHLRVGDEITLIPNFKGLDDHDKFTVLSIEKNHHRLHRGIPGDIVGVKIQSNGKKLEFQRKRHHGGSILIHHSPSPSPSTNQLFPFDAILCFAVMLERSIEVKTNSCGVMVIHTAKTPIRIVSLLQKLDARTRAVIEENPKSFNVRQGGLVLIRPDYLAWPEKRKKDLEQRRSRPRGRGVQRTSMVPVLPNDGYCVESYAKLAHMGRFAVYLDGGVCAMVGIIKEVHSCWTG